MIDIAILLLINSALCFGFWNACLYENTGEIIYIKGEINYVYNKGVLWRLDKWAKDKWFYKPLCGCLPCMASLHSIYPYWIYVLYADVSIIQYALFYPVYILALSGVNYLIDRG